MMIEKILTGKLLAPILGTNYFSPNVHLAHYTSASALFGIFESKTLWMRDIRLLNDKLEFVYAKNSIEIALRGNHCRLIIEQIMLGLGLPNSITFEELLLNAFNYTEYVNAGTINFAACYTQHNEKENGQGRLSMWRAHGRGEVPVCIIFKPTAKIIGRVTPVIYLSEDKIPSYINQLFSEIKNNINTVVGSIVKGWGSTQLVAGMCVFLMNLINQLSFFIRHPGFNEEVEWRSFFISMPHIMESFQNEIKVYQGIPQRILHLPLDDRNLVLKNSDNTNTTIYATSLDDKIDEIIIGPCANPDIVRDAILFKMQEQNMNFDATKVLMSGIPLRV